MSLALTATALLTMTSLAGAEEEVLGGKNTVLEKCFKMKKGQRLSYSFESAHPVDFNLHYHEGEKVTYPIKKDGVKTDKGAFTATLDQDYCLMWGGTGKTPFPVTYAYKVE